MTSLRTLASQSSGILYLLVLLPFTWAGETDGPSLKDTVIAAHGGLEAMNEAQMLFVAGETTIEVSKLHMHDHTELYVALHRPAYKQISEDSVTGFDGNRPWPQMETPNGPITMKKEAALSAWLFNIPVLLKNAGIRFEESGVWNFKDQSFQKVKVYYEDKPACWLGIDQTSGLITVIANLEKPEQQYTLFSDFREVDGLILPFLEEAQGIGASVKQVVEKRAFKSTIPKDFFKEPTN